MSWFLLRCNRCRLVSLILAALCANVGMPSPQEFIGVLAHSVTHELCGNSSHSLIFMVHNLSITPDKNASVKLYIFNSKLNWDGAYRENILSLVWLRTFREEIFARIFSSLDSNSFFGSELSALKSKILPKYLKWPPKGTAGIKPFPCRPMLGKTC